MLRQMPVHRYNCIEYVPAVTKGVMQHGLGLLLVGTRNTDDVDDRDVLGERWKDVSGTAGCPAGRIDNDLRSPSY